MYVLCIFTVHNPHQQMHICWCGL